MKTYIKENDISLIIDRKNVLMGNTNLDITNIIVEKLNKEFPSLSIK
jgi:Skp family chaperone for outer membrane proteins